MRQHSPNAAQPAHLAVVHDDLLEANGRFRAGADETLAVRLAGA